MENLTKEFSDIVGLRQDSWECHAQFIAKEKKSLNLQVLSTRDQVGLFYILYVNVKTINKIKHKLHKCVHKLHECVHGDKRKK
jgi:hypothetical protein